MAAGAEEVVAERTQSYVGAVSESTKPNDQRGKAAPANASKAARARSAFASGNAEDSRLVHDTFSTEQHDSAGEFVKVMVFGGA